MNIKFHYTPALPDPSRAENGMVKCNEPLKRGDLTVGYCCAWVRPESTRFRRAGWHRGPHRIEWANKS